MSGGKRRSGAQVVRENVEAILVAIVLALIIRHFSVEAFEIPTGSMAPTLYGAHAWVECPNCGTRSALSLGTDRESGKLNVRYRSIECATAVCGACGFPNQVIRDGAIGTESTCQACGKALVVGPLSPVRGIPLFRSRPGDGPWDTRLTCPVCWFRWNDVLREGNAEGGHKILVNKFYFRLIPPRPWDVIVFRFNRKTNYIKRLVGLPGDRIQIRNGDIYRNGAISRKPIAAQDALWTLIHDSDRAESFEAYNAPAWVPADPGGQVGDGPPLWRWTEARTLVVNAPGTHAAVRYGRPCRNFYAYDQLAYGGPGDGEAVQTSRQLVGDRRIEFTLAWLNGRGGLRIRMEDGPDRLSAWIPSAAAARARPAALERAREGIPAESAALPSDAGVAIPPDRPIRVAFENVDDRLRLQIDGREVLRLDFESGSPAVDRNELRLEAEDLQAELRSIRIYRDIHYSWHRAFRYAQSTPIEVSQGEYFALGDNSPSSSDGRHWGPIPAQNMLGKAFLVFWPALPWRWEVKLIR